MGWFSVSRIGVSDLHHGGGAVGGVDGAAVGSAETGVGGEDVGPAVLAAEHRPLGEYRQAAEGSGHGRSRHGVGQDLIVEGHVDAVVIAVEGHGFHIDVGVQEPGGADLHPGGAVQELLGRPREPDPQILDAVLVTAGVRDLSGVDGHGLPQVIGHAPQGVHALFGHDITSLGWL